MSNKVYFEYVRAGASAAEVNAYNFINNLVGLIISGQIQDYLIIRERVRDGVIYFELVKKETK